MFVSQQPARIIVSAQVPDLPGIGLAAGKMGAIGRRAGSVGRAGGWVQTSEASGCAALARRDAPLATADNRRHESRLAKQWRTGGDLVRGALTRGGGGAGRGGRGVITIDSAAGKILH